MSGPDETHDPSLKSWVDSANAPDCEFPIQNLPLGIFRRPDSQEAGRPGVALGDRIADLRALRAQGLLRHRAGKAVDACRDGSLNGLMALGPKYWTRLRLELSKIFRAGSAAQTEAAACLVPMSEAQLLLPSRIGNFTDFYTSIVHATNAGKLFRPDNPLMPNFKSLPVAYHARASSIAVSGTPCRRPLGQTRGKDVTDVSFGPSRRLDFELELGFYVGPGNALGTPIPLDDAEWQVFGLSLVNDWSARDIQAWEYVPLGPFLGKSFLTTVSPWVVTLEALAPFRTAAARPDSDPPPLAHLSSARNDSYGGLDITVEAYLQSTRMREQGLEPVRIARAPFASQYWTIFQMLAHHASNGCNLVPGDLLGTGTISGPGEGEQGSLLEITAGGTRSFGLPEGEIHSWLEDGDEVIFRAYCEREGWTRIGFGECSGRIVPALNLQK